MGDRYTQVAKDQARVVGMIGQVHGDVEIGVGGAAPRTTAADLPALLDALRGEVAAVRGRGEIDDTRAEAVVAELDEAARHLPATDETSKGRFVVAMMRAKGLVEGLAGLTTTVSEAISAVQGLS